jgi:translation initiation factor 5B
LPVRQPIVCVLGHVDTGKTLLLDKIRKTSVQAREVGGITQHIGASYFPLDTITQLIGPLLSMIKSEIQIPGLLIIDTPGHEAFTNLRRRGGSVADIAILVIDVLRGFELQTYECIEILKARKTPFLVAANKIDRIAGWNPVQNATFQKSYASQFSSVKEDLDIKIYEILGGFSRLEFKADRFDHIKDFTKTVAVVPTSAKTGEGITELLLVLVGLTQQYLKNRLQMTEGPAKGTVLEVKDEPGLGLTLNTIIYDGILQKDELVVIGSKEKPIVTRTRAILVPKPLDEIRDPRNRFSAVNSVSAAAGVKIVAPDLTGALPGAPLYVIPFEDQVEEYVKVVSEEIEKIRILTDLDGVVLKADTLGSLEAIAESLKRGNVQVRIADVGDVSRRDVIEALVVKGHEPFLGVILAFNVKVLPDAKEEALNNGIKIFQENIIYRLIENYVSWVKIQQETKLKQELEHLVTPAKIRVIDGYVFRKAKPAIFGVEILAGKIRSKLELIRLENGEIVGEIQQIQEKGKNLQEAKQGMQVAISMEKPIIGRHIFERDVLYVKIPESHAKGLLTTYIDTLTLDEKEVLDEYIKLMRTKIPFWAM